MELEIDDEGNRTVWLNNYDSCIDCEQQYGCPLIECIANGLVEPTCDIEVYDCAHKVMFDR